VAVTFDGSINSLREGKNLMDFEASVRTQWAIFHDTVRELAPYLDMNGLHHVISEVRPSRVSQAGISGPWAHLPEELDNQRERLLYDLVDIAEEKSGKEWPFIDDKRPEVPESPEDLLK
jgi:hypothetical protein